MTAKPFWSKAGTPPLSANPNVPPYGTGSADPHEQLVAGNNAAAIASVSGLEPRRTAFHRGAMGAAEAIGARLSVSPSAKIPQNDPASGMTQSNTRMVKSRAGRANNFQEGTSGW